MSKCTTRGQSEWIEKSRCTGSCELTTADEAGHHRSGVPKILVDYCIRMAEPGVCGVTPAASIDASQFIKLRHGSKDSVDVDVVWVSFAPLPNRVDCLSFCNASKAENGNLIYVDKEEGVVLDVLKGVNQILTVFKPSRALLSLPNDLICRIS